MKETKARVKMALPLVIRKAADSDLESASALDELKVSLLVAWSAAASEPLLASV